MRIYTLGYHARKVEDVEMILDKLDAILVDVRLKPLSRWMPAFNAKSLAQRLGERYVWLREFGNLNFRGGPIQIADFASSSGEAATGSDGQEHRADVCLLRRGNLPSEDGRGAVGCRATGRGRALAPPSKRSSPPDREQFTLF